MVYGILITIIYLRTVLLNGSGVTSLFETSFKAYDYVNMVAVTIFVGFNVVYAQYTINLSDHFRFKGEVLTVSSLIVVGLLVFWLVFRAAKLKQAQRLAIAFYILIGTFLLILVTIDWNLYKARVWSCPKSFHNLTIDEIMGLSSIRKQFEEHLRKEYSLENLNFLQSCERYHELLRQSDKSSVSCDETECRADATISLRWSMEIPNRRSSMARYIFEEFCKRGAPQEINLSRKISRKLRDRFKINDSPFGADILDDAIECTKDLLTNDSLRRFKIDTGYFYERL